MASKYYAVRKGKKPGIYRTWDACKAQVNGFSQAEYKSFLTQKEAEEYMNQDQKVQVEENCPFAFVDGSFNIVTKVYGYGGFLEYDGKRKILQGHGSDPEMASMRNVAGEVLGSMAAIKCAVELGIPQLRIFYDYLGIEMWATGQWKRNKSGTIAYHDYVNSVKNQIQLQFVKVKGHSGVEGNELADQLAKKSVGIL